MIQARIAGLSVSFDGGDHDFFSRRLRAYEEKIQTPDLTMNLSRESFIDTPCGEELLLRDGQGLTRLPNGDLCRYTVSKKTGRVLYACYSSPDYSRFDYAILDVQKRATRPLSDFEYLYTGEAFANRLAYLGGLVMHGSAIAYDGQGIIFSAPSGTGKSTHAALWKQRYGERVQHINDDKPAIRFDGNTPTVYGTPWSGKTDTNANVCAPLTAIVFLQQASQNRIQPLTASEACCYLYRETVRPFYDEALGVKVLETAEKLLETVPVFLLECTISEQAVELVKNATNLAKGKSV